jgi:hypothetical protein
MNNVLREYLDFFVSVYIDNILVYSRMFEEYVKYVRIVLHALKKFNLRLKKSKCEFYKKRIKFVGCFVSAEGLEIDSNIYERVKEWPVPSGVKGIQLFYTFANYYR